jgi:hypothetical protein
MEDMERISKHDINPPQTGLGMKDKRAITTQYIITLENP